MTIKEWYSVRDFAKLIGWSDQHVRRHIKWRYIKAQRMSDRGHWSIPRSECIRWDLITDDENDVDFAVS